MTSAAARRRRPARHDRLDQARERIEPVALEVGA